MAGRRWQLPKLKAKYFMVPSMIDDFGVLGGPREAPVYDRSKFATGHRIAGPALIQEYASTTVLPPGDVAIVDERGNLDIAVEAN